MINGPIQQKIHGLTQRRNGATRQKPLAERKEKTSDIGAVYKLEIWPKIAAGQCFKPRYCGAGLWKSEIYPPLADWAKGPF
jgi:hypothetical protein